MRFTVVLHSKNKKPLSNPLLIAAKGKGFLPMLARGRVIVSRYGLTPGKMENALATFMDTLSTFACSASIPITASALSSNPAVAKKYSSQGLELAVHGLHHLDYSLLSLKRQLDHMQHARGIFQRLGLPVIGFRCPYLRWNEDTLTALKASGYTYDSSQALDWDVVGGLSTDSYHRALDFYRSQSANKYPALPGWSDSLVRIPYCLPDDEALVDRLHLSNPDEMAEIWLEMLSSTYEAGELLTLGLHPERIHLCQAAFQTVLEKARSLSPRVWIARLDEITAWYLSLGKTTFEIHQDFDGQYELKLNAPEKATILVRSLEVAADEKPWMQGYSEVRAHKFTFRCDRRPLIGLSPNIPAALERFLRHQGYLVETSTEFKAHSYYLDSKTFDPEDERPLLASLEREKMPLVRISRWPEDARCGLAITGDIDAFTIWDYGKRIFAQ